MVIGCLLFFVCFRSAEHLDEFEYAKKNPEFSLGVGTKQRQRKKSSLKTILEREDPRNVR